MSKTHPDPTSTLAAAATENPRKPYERPRILYREPLEALAISCTSPGGKGDPINCPVFSAS
ncbi:MAG: hypothetical protein IPK60_08140 [Sandaracinaceae bacterium]|jgi:hypothetical protein|nr:hypothetical protein [Sandaracinaceae bacterium]